MTNEVSEPKKYIIEKDGRKREARLVTCAYCNTDFLKATRFIKKNNYCNTKCSSAARITKEKLTCTYCNVEFLRAKSKLKNSRSGYYFCSKGCKDEAQKISFGLVAI